VLIAAGFVGWRAFISSNPVDHEGDAPAVVAASAAPTATSPARVNSAPSRVIEVRALSASWLEARGPDGTVFLSRTLQAGDVYRPDASPGWTLHARDGGAFEVYVNGADAGPLGITGMPVLGRQIDAIQPVAQAALTPPRS